MDNYQPTPNFPLTHLGGNTTEAQPAGASHPAQHALGVIDNTTARPRLPAANEAEETMGLHNCTLSFNQTHTCATGKDIAPSNNALEKHGSKEHKPLQCTCTQKFTTHFALDRHIAEKTGPKYYRDSCKDNKAILREERFIKHLRASYQLGDQVIAELLSRACANLGANGLASSAATTADTVLLVSTSTGYYAALDAPAAGLQGLMGYSAGPPDDSIGVFHDGVADLSVFNAAGLQPLSMDGQHMLPSAYWDFAGLDNSRSGFPGVESSVVDLSLAGFPGDGCLFAEFPGGGCLCTGFSGSGSSGSGFSGADVADGDSAVVEEDLDMFGMDNGI